MPHELSVALDLAFQQLGKVCNVGNCERINALDLMSKVLLKHPEIRQYPDLASFAFFCRRKGLLSSLGDCSELFSRRGLGVVFHITPNNIPMNFALSFVFGYLSGNVNIVKLPVNTFRQIDIFVEVFTAMYAQGHFTGQFFSHFSRSDPSLAEAVYRSDAVLIWGGDQTISEARKMTRKPRSITWEFPDRFSISAINLSSISHLNENELSRFTYLFFNDTFFVDQNACSSPRLIIWIDENDSLESEVDRFWMSLETTCRARSHIIGPVERIARMINVARSLDENVGVGNHPQAIGSFVERVSIADGGDSWVEYLGSFGVFYEARLHTISDVSQFLTSPKLQTITYFGLDPVVIKEMVLSKGEIQGVDRIVPVGRALDFALEWDGRCALQVLSRGISML